MSNPRRVLTDDNGVVSPLTSPANLVDVTLSLDTGIYAAGDVLAETQAVAAAVRLNGGGGILQSLVVIDQDDQGAALDIYILGTNVSMGAENGQPAITDANALQILARVPVAALDYVDLGGAKVANIKNIGAVVKAAPDSTSLYVAAVNGAGTPTYTAAG